MVVSACRSTPPAAAHESASQCRAPMLDSLSDYARNLRHQDADALQAEKTRLEALPESPSRDLQLALLLGQDNSALYDPGRAAQLLVRTASQPSATATEQALAEILFASVAPKPKSCEATGYTQELANRLIAEEQRRQELAAKLESTRQALDTERAQREKLEKQLEALKSIEEQIKNRENESGR